ncbi:MAG TPA: septum site-determining protein MinC [Ideonella sp.]|uniref:septum site-determining protein MinC n=1 Tax=Ideonella sp. TaxID=1929293 RepID=UPI002E34AC61|nr:septum site-determining protein MinC [Ideonella sp.]HEX5682749.1 septum site-determining protein MinC [Ideonella sp.]
MAAVSTGSAPAVFELKNTSLPLVSLVLKTTELAALADQLAAQLRDTPQLFNHDPVVVDLTALPKADDGVDAAAEVDKPPLDFPALIELLKAHRMLPVAVAGASAAQLEAALAAGLGEAPEPVQAPKPARPVVQEVVREIEVIREVVVEVPAAHVPTLVIDRPLRSGQQVYAKGGDLVVLAAVNFGAEVIADGHIHVYAPLRGKAIAGNKGNTQARIFSTCLEPELISIAGVYRTTETALPADVHGKPAQVRLVDDKLVMEPLKEPLKEPKAAKARPEPA